MKNQPSVRKLQFLFGLTLAAALTLAPGASRVFAATALDTNLIVNGDAEASPGATNYNVAAPPAGWTTTSDFSVVRYDAASSDTNPLRPANSMKFGGGANFFAGGPNNADSSATQTIDISDRAAEIDGGTLTAALSGYFGSIYPQYDAMTLNAQFRNAQGQQYAVTSIGNVSRGDLNSSTDLLYRSRNQPIPIGTRSIVVTLRATRADTTSDTYNDGYADNVRLELVKTGGVNTFAESYGNIAPVLSNPSRGFDYPNGIAPMPDGGVVVTGVLGRTIVSGESYYNYDVLIRYGADGKILWQKEFPDSGGAYANGFVTTDTQGGVYFASAFHPNYGAPYPFVAKFDVNGVQQWFTNVQVPVKDIPNNVYSDQDSYINSPFTGIYLSPQGNLVLGTSILVDTRNQVYIPGIVTVNAATGSASCLGLNSTLGRDTTATGPAFVVPSLTVPGRLALLTGSPDRGPELVLIDSSGKTIATREAVASGNDLGGGMIPTSDGGYLVFGVGHISKFSADLNLEFQKVSSEFKAYSATQTADGGYLLCAVVNRFSLIVPNATGSKVAVIKLTPQGGLDGAYALGGAGNEASFYSGTYPCAAVVTADGGVALATSTTSYTGDTTGAPDWWVVKTDKLGRIANFQDVMVDISTSIFMRDADASNGYPAPHDGIGFDDPKGFALQNPARENPPLVVPQSLVSTDPDGTTRVQAHAAFPAPPPPPHGGIAGTTFAVNGSDQPSYPPVASAVNGLADTVFKFTAGQTSHAAGLYVRVQATTTPTVESSWTDLPTATGGHMTADVVPDQYVLNTTNVPLQSAVYFRAISAASGYTPDSISNVVGPFNLSGGKPRLPRIALSAVANGMAADLVFDATGVAFPAGTDLRVQFSATPGNESSWTDLKNGNAGHMTQTTDPNLFRLLVGNLPAASNVYFRAVAALSGYADSLSGAIARVNVTPYHPPKVTVQPPVGLSGSGTRADRLVLRAGDKITFGAQAVGDRPLRSIDLEFNGEVVNGGHFDQPLRQTLKSATFSLNRVGDGVLEAIASDDRGLTARAGSSPIYVRVIPAASAARAGSNAGVSSAAASTGFSVFKVANSGGDWNDSTTWVDSRGNHGVPGLTDFAVIGESSVKIGGSAVVSVGSVSLDGGHLSGPATIQVYGVITISAGSFDSGINLVVKPQAYLELQNEANFRLDGTIFSQGICNIHGSGGVLGLQNFLATVVHWQRPLTVPLDAGLNLLATTRILSTADATISGRIDGVNPGRLIGEGGSTVISNDGATLITNDGATVISNDGATLITNDGGSLITQDGAGVINGTGSGIIGLNGSGIMTNAGANLISIATNSSGASANIRAATAASGVTVTGGEVDLSSCSIAGSVTLNGGVLSGSGIIQGDLINNGGYIAPGHSPGVLGVTGAFTQGANGTLIVENGGPYPSQFDQLRIGGIATLGGKLDVKLINGYMPDPLDTFSPLGYSSASGSFASISGNAQVKVNGTGILASVDPAKPNPKNGQPLNIATRLQIQGGDNLLIAGFIVTGPAGATKKVLVRGLGPTLSKFGVPGALADPLLELHDGAGGLITSNDNWQSNDISQIPEAYRTNIDPLDSIVAATLTVGSNGLANYTAVLKGAHGETGVGLAEVYDLEPDSAAQLANIATRGFVQTGDNVMIGGFIIGGSEPAKVLVRVTGPTLKNFGITGQLDDPTLELHDSNGAVISNDNWRETQESEITASKLQPVNDREPAILATLVPGSYTAVVRGKEDTTGIAVVEAYTLM